MTRHYCDFRASAWKYSYSSTYETIRRRLQSYSSADASFHTSIRASDCHLRQLHVVDSNRVFSNRKRYWNPLDCFTLSVFLIENRRVHSTWSISLIEVRRSPFAQQQQYYRISIISSIGTLPLRTSHALQVTWAEKISLTRVNSSRRKAPHPARSIERPVREKYRCVLVIDLSQRDIEVWISRRWNKRFLILARHLLLLNDFQIVEHASI